MSKNEYYICSIDNLEISDNQFEKLFNEEITYKELLNLELQFLIVLPDTDDDICDYNTDINENTLKYNKLSDLIDDFKYNFYEDSDEIDIDEIAFARFDLLLDSYIVVKRNKKTNKYIFVKDDDLIACHETMLKNDLFDKNNIISNVNEDEHDEMRLSKINDKGEIKNNNIDEVSVRNFTDIVEKYLEHDWNHVLLVTECGNCYEVCIMKYKGKMFDILKDNKDDDEIDISNEIPSKLNYVYENGYNNLIGFIKRQLLSHSALGVSFKTHVTKENKINENALIKVFSGVIFVDNNSKLCFEQANAKDVFDSYTTNAKTGEKIKPDKNIIYCGKDKDDFICGFDMV